MLDPCFIYASSTLWGVVLGFKFQVSSSKPASPQAMVSGSEFGVWGLFDGRFRIED
jgi:hypothetical protein